LIRELDDLDPPGEDQFEVPETLGRFVEACTWLRRLVLDARTPPRGPALTAAGTTPTLPYPAV
jgi:hypothetical protein